MAPNRQRQNALDDGGGGFIQAVVIRRKSINEESQRKGRRSGVFQNHGTKGIARSSGGRRDLRHTGRGRVICLWLFSETPKGGDFRKQRIGGFLNLCRFPWALVKFNIVRVYQANTCKLMVIIVTLVALTLASYQ